jgi:hypothetical protein
VAAAKHRSIAPTAICDSATRTSGNCTLRPNTCKGLRLSNANTTYAVISSRITNPRLRICTRDRCRTSLARWVSANSEIPNSVPLPSVNVSVHRPTTPAICSGVKPCAE